MHVVRLKEHFVIDENQCIVMEYMAGGDLQQFFEDREGAPISELMISSILSQVGNALKYLHTNGYIHKDIKLENVMLSNKKEDCEAKLADFGLSEKIGSETERCKAGTLGYMAPEILAGEKYGAASDIFSLGCLLHMMLTMVLPFDAQKSRFGKISVDTVSDLSSYDFSNMDLNKVDASESCKEILERMVKRNPEERPTIQEVLEHPFFNLNK